jgi:hypothetical protein
MSSTCAVFRLIRTPPGYPAAAFPHEVALDNDVTAFGRSRAQCDVTFDSGEGLPKVMSRLHASVLHAGERQWVIRDEASLNGTYVNEERIPRAASHLLRSGDCVTFGAPGSLGGQLLYKFVLLGEAPSAMDDDVARSGASTPNDLSAPCGSPAMAMHVSAFGFGANSAVDHRSISSAVVDDDKCKSLGVGVDGGLVGVSDSSSSSSNIITINKGCIGVCASGGRCEGCGARGGAVSSSSSSSSSSASSSSSSCFLKRDRSKTSESALSNKDEVSAVQASGDPCPFASLVGCVMSHAKKLCRGIGACRSAATADEEAVMAAARAACDALDQFRSKSKSVAVSLSAVDEAAPEEEPIIPLRDPECDLAGASPLPSSSSTGSNSSSSGIGISGICTGTGMGMGSSESGISGICTGMGMGMGSSESKPPAAAPLSRASSLSLAAASADGEADAALSKKISELTSELTCPICQDSFINTNTLACGHSYCEPCVNSWLGKCLTCPVCRDPVNKPPVRSRIIDKTVEVALQSSQSSCKALESLAARRAQCEADHANALKTRCKIVAAIGEARAKGQPLMHISKAWSETEQHRFLKCLRGHLGPSREAFCASVNLTPCFISRASMLELGIAARNIKLDQRKCAVHPDLMDAAQLRDRLSLFIRYS